MECNIKIVQKQSFDKPPRTYYVIQETVTPNGHTIEWPGIYGSKESAQKEIDAHLKKV